ncbi:hypothetical protein HYX13_03845 [Candidatus Woesearchaeota archaeon]|nr:hypothetical protein [Candidatus Woesearchaeota archaeon]
MVKTQFRELETFLKGIDVLVLEVENSKEETPLSADASKKIARDFGALKQIALRWISEYLTPNTLKTEKQLLEEIAAGLQKIEAVNSQFAPAKLTVMIRKLREF